jgi:chromosomal replication initiation ATPase DnaA
MKAEIYIGLPHKYRNKYIDADNTIEDKLNKDLLIILNYFNLSEGDYFNNIKNRELTYRIPRQIFFYYAIIKFHSITERQLEILLKKDRCTIRHGHKTINDLLFSDKQIQKIINELNVLLKVDKNE